MAVEIQTVGIIGGGVMGSGIAQVLASAGLKVVLYDLSQEALDKALDSIKNGRYGLTRGVELGKLDRSRAAAAVANITLTTSLEDGRDVDLVLEAVPEDLELKRRVFVQVDKVVRSQTIFATNTSGFAISHLNQASGRKDRFLGMHWFSPAPVMRLVELIHAPETSEETLETIERLCERLGKMSVRIKDAPGSYGFVANRIYFAAVREAQKVLEAGIASGEDINKAMVYGYNWPVGPLAMAEQARRGWA